MRGALVVILMIFLAACSPQPAISGQTPNAWLLSEVIIDPFGAPFEENITTGIQKGTYRAYSAAENVMTKREDLVTNGKVDSTASFQVVYGHPPRALTPGGAHKIEIDGKRWATITRGRPIQGVSIYADDSLVKNIVIGQGTTDKQSSVEETIAISVPTLEEQSDSFTISIRFDDCAFCQVDWVYEKGVSDNLPSARSSKTDIGQCDGLADAERDECLIQLSIAENDPSACAYATSADSCYSLNAISTDNVDLVVQHLKGEQREQALALLASLNGNEEALSLITKDEYYNFALTNSMIVAYGDGTAPANGYCDSLKKNYASTNDFTGEELFSVDRDTCELFAAAIRATVDSTDACETELLDRISITEGFEDEDRADALEQCIALRDQIAAWEDASVEELQQLLENK